MADCQDDPEAAGAQVLLGGPAFRGSGVLGGEERSGFAGSGSMTEHWTERPQVDNAGINQLVWFNDLLFFGIKNTC